jgi:recombination protein RecR
VPSAYDQLIQQLKKLPGLGSRSAERIAIHLLAEKPDKASDLAKALERALLEVSRCSECGNLSESPVCPICSQHNRDHGRLCIVESVSDLMAFEKAAAWNGLYHVLNGKLSPLRGIGPNQLNLQSLSQRLTRDKFSEVLLALPNDIEGEATCHYLQEQLFNPQGISAQRIGFGLPSGGDIPYADASTLRNALESSRGFR